MKMRQGPNGALCQVAHSNPGVASVGNITILPRAICDSSNGIARIFLLIRNWKFFKDDINDNFKKRIRPSN